MRPPFSYYGGKVGMARRLVDLLPPHETYIEPFFGSGAVLFAKHPSTHEIVNDLDTAVTTFFRVLRDQPLELERACALTPYSRAEYQAADLDSPIEDLELARRFWVRVSQSFSKTAGRRTGWSVTTARTQSAATTARSRLSRFAVCAERLANVTIETCDAVDLIERLATPKSVIYADPPYVGDTRKSGGGTDYRCDMADEQAHRDLAAVLHATQAAVILSGYPSPLYDQLYRDWWTIDVPVTVHSSNAARVTRGARIERVWSNRDLEDGRLPWGAAL